MKNLILRALAAAAAAASLELDGADAADFTVAAGGMEFVVPARKGLLAVNRGRRRESVFSSNIRVGGGNGKAAAFPDGRDDRLAVLEDSAARCVVRIERSLSIRDMSPGAEAAGWNAARLVVDYVFMKDMPACISAARLVAVEPFTFFSWNMPHGQAFAKYAVDGASLRPYPTQKEFRAQAGGYRTESGLYVIGETPAGERWWMGREFATFCPFGDGKPGGFYANCDTMAAGHGKNVVPGDVISLSVSTGVVRDDSDIGRYRAFRAGDGRIPVPVFPGSWSSVPAAAWRGETKDYRPVAGLNWNGAKDLSFTLKIAQEAGGLLMHVDVTDDVVVNPFTEKDTGLGDSVHFSLADAAGERTFDRVVSAKNAERTADGYRLEFKAGWSELAAAGIDRSGGVRLNVCVADMDRGTDRENWMGVSDGILGGRDVTLYPLLDLAGVVTKFLPERPVLPDHETLKSKIAAIAAANDRLPADSQDEYTSCLKAMTDYFLEFMRSDLDAVDTVAVSHRTKKIDDAYRYYMDDRVNKNAEYLLELQKELAARQKDLAAGRVEPVRTVRHPADARPVIEDGGFKVAGRELLLIGPDTWTNVKGWKNDDIGIIAKTGFNQLDCFYVGGTNYFDVVRRAREGGLYCVWGAAADTDTDLLEPKPEWSIERQNAHRWGMGYSMGSMVPSNPAPNFVFQITFPEQWTRKKEQTEEWAAAFRTHLDRKFGGLGALNTALGADYADWKEIDFAAALKNDALKYESFLYRMESNMRRDIPQQKWLASRFGLPRSVHFSTHYNIASLDPLVSLSDFEALWSMFDIVGFDGGFGIEGSEWAFDFPKGGFELDFARSVYPGKPVANNENHVVGDGTYMEYEKGLTYASNMLAFLMGQNSSSVWDWANTRHTYGEYVFTRANTYHEMVMCALDLRRYAEEIAAFRRAPAPPFRILHSLPSFAERDPYVYSLYGLYGATSFTGWATRFITERNLAKGDFKGVKIIVVPDARRVSDKTFAALESFAAAGGTVLVDGAEALTKDQWGKNVASRAAALAKFRRFPGASSRERFEALDAALSEKRIVPPLDLRTTSGKKPFGVMWRTGRTAAGEQMAFLANLSRSPAELSIPGRWTDVFGGGGAAPSKVILRPYDILLLKKR